MAVKVVTPKILVNNVMVVLMQT